MELDEFSHLFNAQFAQLPTEKSAEELTRQIQKRSGTALDRIMRNLLLEVGFGVFMVLLMTFLATRHNSITVWWLTGLLWFIGIIQVVAFIWQYRQLKSMVQPAVTDLRTHLQQHIRVIERFVRVYLAFSLWSVPVGFVFGGYIGYTIADRNLDDPSLKPIDDLRLSATGLIVGCLALLLLLVGILFLIKAYVRWLYGRHLDQLKACLTEIDA